MTHAVAADEPQRQLPSNTSDIYTSDLHFTRYTSYVIRYTPNIRRYAEPQLTGLFRLVQQLQRRRPRAAPPPPPLLLLLLAPLGLGVGAAPPLDDDGGDKALFWESLSLARAFVKEGGGGSRFPSPGDAEDDGDPMRPSLICVGHAGVGGWAVVGSSQASYSI